MAETGRRRGGGSARVRDAVGNVLRDDDSVTVIKDLKIKGSAAAACKSK